MTAARRANIVLILPSQTYRAGDFIAAAESLDIDLIVASEQAAPIEMGDRYLQIDCSNPEVAAEEIARLGETTPIDGVVAADDPGVLIAAYSNEILGLTGNSPEAASATRNKVKMRERLAAAEVDQPDFAPLAPGDNIMAVAANVGFPLVVKPTDRSASQGVIRVDRPEDLQATEARIRKIVGDRATLLVESYVPGAEIAIEGLIIDGDLEVLAVFDKPDTSPGPYFPETLFITPSRLPEAAVAEAERVAAASVSALELTTGPVHIELRVEDDRARVLEVAARSIGGLCSRSLNFGLTATTLESLILRNALGMTPSHLRRERVASGVLMIPTTETGTLARIRGEEEARAIEGVTGIDLTIRSGGEVLAPPEGDRYLGFVYARSGTPEEVEAALRKAMEILEVQVEV